MPKNRTGYVSFCIIQPLCEKCPNISGPYFPVFGLNMEIYSVNLLIQSGYRKTRTRNNSLFEHFSRSATIVLDNVEYFIDIFNLQSKKLQLYEQGKT